MDLIGLAIAIIVIVAVIAIVVWFVKSSGIVIPQPLLVAIYAILAIVAIVCIVHFSGVQRVW